MDYEYVYQKFANDDWMLTDLYGIAKNRSEYDTYEGGKDNERCINVFFGRVEDERFAEFYVFCGRVEVLRHLFMEDFMTKNTFFECLHDLKEFIKRQTATLIDAQNVDCEIFTSSPELTSGSMDALFALTSKQTTV